MKLDVKRREWDVVVIGEEPHLAYNRVGLTSFFQHRKVENLYLNPEEWVRTSTPQKYLEYEAYEQLVPGYAARLIELSRQHTSH